MAVNQVGKTLKFPNDLTCQTLQSAQTLLKSAESEATSNECAWCEPRLRRRRRPTTYPIKSDSDRKWDSQIDRQSDRQTVEKTLLRLYLKQTKRKVVGKWGARSFALEISSLFAYSAGIRINLGIKPIRNWSQLKLIIRYLNTGTTKHWTQALETPSNCNRYRYMWI